MKLAGDETKIRMTGGSFYHENNLKFKGRNRNRNLGKMARFRNTGHKGEQQRSFHNRKRCGNMKKKTSGTVAYSTKTGKENPGFQFDTRGLYNGKGVAPGGGEYQPMSFGGKNMKRLGEKGGKCKKKEEREKKKEEREKKKEEREKKMRKGEVKV